MADPSGIDVSGYSVGVAGSISPVAANVQVYLEVALDLSGIVDVLGAAVPTLYQVVKCKTGIKTTSLHLGDTSGILEFWQNDASDAGRESVEACISSTGRNEADASYNTFEDFSGALYQDLSGIFCNSTDADNLNAVAAVPFNALAYSPAGVPVAAYTKFKTLGDMMLSWAAHYAFGHVAATAAIDNDTQIIKRFNLDLDVPRLFMNGIAALDKTKASRIARSVIAQDPERALNMDHNTAAPFQHQALRFRAGDILYLRINMAKWTVVDNYTNPTYTPPAGTNPVYSGEAGAATSLVSAAELTRLADRLPFYRSNVGGTDNSTNTDGQEAARGVYFHFEIPVVNPPE
jgi:hypothetical protein